MATWIAMDDVGTENGTLRVIPGSHRRRLIWPLRPYADSECAGERSEEHPFDEIAEGQAVSMRSGAVLFFHGYLLHGSTRNKPDSGSLRRILTNHYMSCESLLPWNGSADFRDVEICRGSTDPYHWKGLYDQSRPFVRPQQQEEQAGRPRL